MKSNKLKKVLSGVSAFALMSMATAPLTAGADTTSYSTSGAFGTLSGSNGSLELEVRASEFAERAGSNKINGSGASVQGFNYDASGCWVGFGFTDPTSTIQFKDTGALPNQVTASGSVPVTWTNWCDISGNLTSFTETVTFNMDLSAMTGQTISHFGTTQDVYGDTGVKVNTHFDTSDAPAASNASSISSPRFGTVTPTSGSVGRGKSSEVVIQ